MHRALPVTATCTAFLSERPVPSLPQWSPGWKRTRRRVRHKVRSIRQGRKCRTSIQGQAKAAPLERLCCAGGREAVLRLQYPLTQPRLRGCKTGAAVDAGLPWLARTGSAFSPKRSCGPNRACWALVVGELQLLVLSGVDYSAGILAVDSYYVCTRLYAWWRAYWVWRVSWWPVWMMIN